MKVVSFDKIVKVFNKLLKKVNHVPTLIYFGPIGSKNQFMPNILNTKGKEWNFIFCKSWDELETILNDNPHALIVHYSYVSNTSTNISESIINIKPFIKIKNKHPTVRLALAVDSKTTRNIIKEVFGSGYIKNILPCCIDFGFIEYIYGISAILYRTYYCPTKIINLLSWYSFNINYSKNTVNLSMTPRQVEIATLISKNHFSNKQIAKILGISESAVKSHLVKIFKKHNVTNRLQLSNTMLKQK